jgi:hypothetical protein
MVHQWQSSIEGRAPRPSTLSDFPYTACVFARARVGDLGRVLCCNLVLTYISDVF